MNASNRETCYHVLQAQQRQRAPPKYGMYDLLRRIDEQAPGAEVNNVNAYQNRVSDSILGSGKEIKI